MQAQMYWVNKYIEAKGFTMIKQGSFSPQAFPEGFTKEQLLGLRDIVTDDYILDSAVGLNPDLQPGMDVTKVMIAKVVELRKTNPDVAASYSFH